MGKNVLHRGASWGSIPSCSAKDTALVFTGTYEHAIDAKNRLAIPSDVRAQIQRDIEAGNGDTVSLYVTPGEGNVLCIYTETAFERRANQLDDSELDPVELMVYEQLLFSQSRRVDIDKQGRVRLPDPLLRQANLGRDVVLIGVKDHLEVRDRETWLSYVDEQRKKRPGLLMNPRLAMRPR